MPQPPRDPRRTLLECYAAALAAVEPRAATARALTALPPGPLRVIAAGKAAEGMLRAVLAAPALELVAAVIAGLQAAPVDLTRDPRLDWHRGGHPLPDAGSLAAGAAVATLVDSAPSAARFLVLLSGGASALLELARPGVSLGALREVTARGLVDGLDIATLNRERAGLSALKGGGLARQLGPRPTEALFISDVPDDDPRVLGSGPCWDEAAMVRIPHRCVAANADARRAIVVWASSRGIPCRDHGALAGDAQATGESLAAELRTAAPGLHLWGGECTVRLPEGAGRGGRCQQLALAAVATGLTMDTALLACGTDGRDGPGQAAGALVDGSSAQRLAEAGIDVAAALARCDAGTALAAAGDLIDSGPTGTNVADLVIAWRRE